MSDTDRNFTKMNILEYTKERGIIMKNTIKKTITFITVLALAFTLAMPVPAEAASKKAPKLSKTKVTLTITKKKTKPAYKLKVKNTAGKKVKWTTSNKKVVTVSKSGKVVAKKKGSAVVKAKVGKKVLTCKVVVKDNRKPAKKPVKKPEPTPNPVPEPTPTECEHDWVAVTETKYKVACACGEIFDTDDKWVEHNLIMSINGNGNDHSCGPYEETIVTGYKCSKCGAVK